jgi:aspartate aminotransferase
MNLSKIAQSIGASATLMLNAKANKMRLAGEPVIHLGGGEPESKAPESAVEAGMELLRTGELRYTPAAGTPAMRDAIIAYTEKFYGRQVERTNVMASAGAKQAIMVALMALVDPGDEVVFPAPYWVSYPDMARLAGGVPVPVKAADGSILPTLKEIAAAIGKRTRVVMLNSPNNPSGQVYDEAFLRGMVQLCEERDVFLLMDDIYHRLVFDGAPRIHCYDCTERSVNEAPIVVLNGVSKQYAMTGFRIGWAVGPKDLIQAMANIQSHQSGGPCTLSQASAVAAIGGAQGSVATLRETLEKNRDEMVALLREIPGLTVNKPGGTFYCFCDFSAFDEDCTRLSEFLLDKVQVVTVPGVEFGMPGFLRLSYCGSPDDIREGVRRIRWALDPEGSSELTIGDRVIQR